MSAPTVGGARSACACPPASGKSDGSSRRCCRRHPFRALIPRRRCGGRWRPQTVAGDTSYTGYTGRAIRRWRSQRHIRAVIPRLANEPRHGTRFDRAAYRERNRIERLNNRLKQRRRLASRYEKQTCRFLAFATIAAILLWL